LLKSSLLDWMSDPLVAALTGADADAPAAASLLQLFEAGLFVELIDEQEGIYRYHEFFRDFLRHRQAAQTTPQAIATLHREASCWLLGNGYFEEAVRHALASGDQLTAARMVEGQIHALLNRESKTRLESLLNLLPLHLVEKRAPLLIARAWIAHFESRPRAIPPFLQKAEPLLQTAACEFVGVKRALGYTEMEARHELAMWLGHNPHRTEVTYAYVLKN
jgi:ATP/maltotriose-dependent transcriptional regulator MalT